MTGACHAPVYGRQGKSGGDQNEHYHSQRISRPHRKIRRFGDGWQRGFLKFSLPVGGSIEANSVAERMSVTVAFEDLGTTPKPIKTARLPQKPHTPSESPRYFAAVG